MPSVPLPLTFHLELELGQPRAGGHLQVFQLLHHLGQLPLLTGLQGCVLPPPFSSCGFCSSCEASRAFEVPPPDQLHWSLLGQAARQGC